MTVAELIEKLQTAPPEIEVTIFNIASCRETEIYEVFDWEDSETAFQISIWP